MMYLCIYSLRTFRVAPTLIGSLNGLQPRKRHGCGGVKRDVARTTLTELTWEASAPSAVYFPVHT